MIRLECSNCKKILNIDDAFAGGVCRCQFCGTIQTVPKPGQSPASGESQRALFKRKARIESALSPYSDDLDRAADQVDSSHISSGALDSLNNPGRRNPGDSQAPASGTSAKRAAVAASTATESPVVPSSPDLPASPRTSYTPRPSAAGAAAPQQTKSNWPLLLAAAVGLVALGGVGFWLLSRPASKAPEIPPKPADSAPTVTSAPVMHPTPAVAPASGMISGIPLKGSKVVYILDRAGATDAAFAQVLQRTSDSVGSLTSARSFQVILWNNATGLSYPLAGLVPADSAGLEGLRSALAQTSAGTSELAPVLTKAMASNPDEVVFIGFQDLDEMTAGIVGQALKDKALSFHAIIVGPGAGTQLRALAQSGRGEFRQIELAGTH